MRGEERRLQMDVRAVFRSCLRVIGTMSKRLLAAGRALFLSARAWVLCALLVIAALVVYYVLSDRYTPFTTDAFVQAFVIQVTARVEGQVVRVDVQENQPVKKGDLLFEIDPRPFEHRVAVLEARLVDAVDQVAEIKAELADARLNLSWTRVLAPADGYVTNVQLREGSYVRAGAPVLTCIENEQWWVVANYRENSLEYLRPGQRVDISFNTYPGRIFPGEVKTVSPGVYQGQAAPSGNLPAVTEPQDWIKLPQRFPVWVIPELPEGYPLRIGVTASVAVYTREKYWLNGVTKAWHNVVAAFDYLH